MFCNHCGTQNPDGAKHCAACGKAIGSIPQPPRTSLLQRLRASKFFIPAIVGCISFVVIAVVLVVLLGGDNTSSSRKSSSDSKTAPIEKALTGIIKADAEKYMSAYPDDYVEYLEDEYDFDYDDLQDDFEDFLDEMEDEIGDKIKYKIEVVKEKELSESKLDDLKDRLNEYYGLSKRDITEAWEIKVEITLSGSEDDESDEMTIIVIKYNGKWYISPSTRIF